MPFSLQFKRFTKPTDSIGLGVFRLVFALIMILEIISYIKYHQLLYEPGALVNLSATTEHTLLVVWLAVAFFVLFGFYTQVFSVLNLLFAAYFFSGYINYAYHVHYICITISLLMVFFPINQSLSFDFVLSKLKNKPYPQTVPRYYLYVYSLFALGFVYFDSAVWKLFSNYWMSGLSLWMGASYLPIAKYDMSMFLNIKWLMLTFCYITLVFEALFVVLMVSVRGRLLLLLYGAPMHFFIAIIFPLTLFGMMFSLFYVLLVPVSFWRKVLDKSIFNRVFNSIAQLRILKKIPAMPNVRGLKAIQISVLIILLGYQALTTAKPIVDAGRKHLPNEASQKIASFYTALKKLRLDAVTGIAPHALFLDGHFIPRDIYKIELLQDNGKILLPIVTEQGLNDAQLVNISWKLWSLYTARDDKKEAVFVKFAQYWSNKMDVSFADSRFLISRKTIAPVKEWQPDYLKSQMLLPWVPYATIDKSNISYFNLEP